MQRLKKVIHNLALFGFFVFRSYDEKVAKSESTLVNFIVGSLTIESLTDAFPIDRHTLPPRLYRDDVPIARAVHDTLDM